MKKYIKLVLCFILVTILLVACNKEDNVTLSSTQALTREAETGKIQGLIPISSDDKYGLIDFEGNLVVEPRYQYITYYSGGFAVFEYNDKFGFLDSQGNVSIEAKYDHCLEFSEGLAAVLINGEYGFINTEGELVIEPQYDIVQPFSEGLASVIPSNDIKAQFIRKDGTVAIQTDYINCGSFHDGRATISLPGFITSDCGYIDLSGEMVATSKASNSLDILGWDFSDGFGLIRNEMTTGDVIYYFLDKEGDILGDKNFEYAKAFHEGVAYVEQGEKKDILMQQANLYMC